ncbi:MAG: hypothetical protein Q9210_000273 [Variospora velana]
MPLLQFVGTGHAGARLERRYLSSKNQIIVTRGVFIMQRKALEDGSMPRLRRLTNIALACTKILNPHESYCRASHAIAYEKFRPSPKLAVSGSRIDNA